MLPQGKPTYNDPFFMLRAHQADFQAIPSVTSDPFRKFILSDKNVTYLQHTLQKAILDLTGIQIDLQAKEDIIAVQIALYGGSSQFPMTLRTWNKYVLKHLVPKIIREIKHHLVYCNDIDMPLQPLHYPKSQSLRGTKELSAVTDLWRI